MQKRKFFAKKNCEHREGGPLIFSDKEGRDGLAKADSTNKRALRGNFFFNFFF